MNAKRKFWDAVRDGITWVAMIIAVFVLLMIFIYIFRTGASTVSWNMIRGNYNPQTIALNFEGAEAGDFPAPANLPEGYHWSSKYGFAAHDYKDHQKADHVLLTHIEPDSPLQTGTYVSGADAGQTHRIGSEVSLQRLSYDNLEGGKTTAGPMGKMNAEETVQALDTDSVSINSLYYQTQGGGIWGSVKATGMLIVLTLLIALPIGIFAAIYLHELAAKNRFTGVLRSSIEMLAGVPSIIFGLLGLTVFFPLTRIFGAEGQSIFLGALTMVVVLLPVIIRQTEEALRVVPDGFRQGSLALGATRTQTIFRVVLPNALPGILSAALLSVSRIIGESAALIFTMSTIISDNPKVLQPATTLAVQIWKVMSGEQPNFELASAISIIILGMVLILNLSVKLVTSRINMKWK